MIPYGRHEVTQSDIDAVVEVLRSDFLTQGPAVSRFEQAVASLVNAKHAVAVNSATSALHIACLALGLGKGDWLWTVPNTFVASANCARYCGAEVDFVDIDAHTWNLSVPSLKEKLSHANEENRLPKILVPVHFAGQPPEQEAIWELSREFGFKVLEDASHAIGASRNGEPVGNCRWSDITVFSFHPVKIITTAEGGMALTNCIELADRMALLRSHGITRDRTKMTSDAVGPWYYQQIDLGYNYRMTDLQAALGISQLERLNEYVTRRHGLARRYDAELAELPVITPWQHPDCYSAVHLYPIRLKLAEISRSHCDVFEALRDYGIGVNLHYIPVHLQPYYRELGFTEGDFPEAERYSNDVISLPMFPAMTDAEQKYVVRCLQDVLT